MAKIRQFAGQALVYGLGSILSKVVYYLLVVVLLTYLLKDKTYEFGTYGELYGYLTVLIILFSFKLDTALFRFGNKKEDLKEAFDTTGSLVILSAVIILITGLSLDDSIARLIEYDDKPEYIRWFSIILALDVASLVPFARLRLDNKARVFALLKILNVAFSSLLIIFFLFLLPKYNDLGPLALLPKFDSKIDYVFITNIMASLGTFLALLFYIGDFRFRISSNLVKRIVPYVLPLVVVGICNNIIQYNGAAVIKFFSSEQGVLERLSQSGVFDSSRRIAGLFVLFIGAFNYAAEPFFFSNHKAEDRKTLYGKICHVFVLVGGFIILSLVLSKDLLQYMVGESFRESMYIIPVLLVAYLFLGIYHNVSIWYKLSDNTKWGAYISGVGVLITLSVSYLYIPSVGYEAFAWANLFSYFIMLLLAYLVGQRLYKVDYPVKKILSSVILIILLILGAAALENHLNGLIKYVLFGLIFLVYLLYAYRSEKEEWLSIVLRNRS